MATRSVTTFGPGGSVSRADVPISDDAANLAAIEDQAAAALGANRAFLAIPAPTNAQTLTQVKALTRQTNALIRLALIRLDGTD